MSAVVSNICIIYVKHINISVRVFILQGMRSFYLYNSLKQPTEQPTACERLILDYKLKKKDKMFKCNCKGR
ncbi:hypothetical protein ACI65C_009717 [Semiaphis heraclei]